MSIIKKKVKSKHEFSIARVFMILFGFLVTLVAFFILRNTFILSDELKGISLAIVVYFLIVIAIFFLIAPFDCERYKFSNISLFGFYLYNFFVPTIVLVIYMAAYNKWGGLPLDFLITLALSKINSDIIDFSTRNIVLFRCLYTQIVFILLWFLPKLKDENNYEDYKLMRLDYYSTLAIIPLTFIWVIYDLEDVKYGFAIILTVFMIMQALIKRAQMRCVENDGIR